MNFKLEGFFQLEAAMMELEGITAKNVARRALKKAADPVQGNWEGRAPHLTGHYQRSIVVGTKLNPRQSRMNRENSPSEVQVHIGTNDPAGVQTEFGNAHQAAQPSARPAWDAEGGQRAIDRIADELKSETAKAVARAQRKAMRAKGG